MAYLHHSNIALNVVIAALQAGKRMLPGAMAHKSSNPFLTAEQFDDHTCYKTDYSRPAQL